MYIGRYVKYRLSLS